VDEMVKSPARERVDVGGSLLAGSGGLADEAQADHQGRRAILLTREDDVVEFTALAETMGLVIVDTVQQRGQSDPRTYLGSGRLEQVGTDLHASRALKRHDWHGVDLVLIHHNLSPRQLVNIHEAIGIDCWDRVRLLLELFTQHAASVEARTQVRIARLSADRSVLRELVQRETAGERLGFGAGGRHAWRGVLETVNREMASLRRRQRRHAASRRERRRQRARSGALTVGLAGYTNAGKSSLFSALCGKEVLIQDRLFSTLETTVGRMQKGPRVLMVDTIGFIDRLPSDLLDAFAATLSESLECDILLLLADASDSLTELKRRLDTSRRELFERLEEDAFPRLQVVLTKADLVDEVQLEAASSIVEALALPPALAVSSSTGEGIEALRDQILTMLHGAPVDLVILFPQEEGDLAVGAWMAQCHEIGAIISSEPNAEGGVECRLWVEEGDLARLLVKASGQVRVRGESGEQY